MRLPYSAIDTRPLHISNFRAELDHGRVCVRGRNNLETKHAQDQQQTPKDEERRAIYGGAHLIYLGSFMVSVIYQ